MGNVRPMNGPKVKKRTLQRIFLHEWRKHRGKTQDQVAAAVGVSKVHVSNIERGQRQYTQELLEAFADYLQCEPWQILNVDPTTMDASWSIWETVRDMSPADRERASAVIRALGTGRPDKKSAS